MILWNFLQDVFQFMRNAKTVSAKDAEENTQAEERKTQESAKIVSEKPLSAVDHLTDRGGEMTVDEAKQKLITWVRSQVGYHESWDGSNKYGSDGDWDQKLYGFEASNVAWCDVFVDYAFIHCFGYDEGTAMTYQKPAGYAACSLSADAYKRNGAFYQTPEVGDQIFFYYGNGINHTGIVVSVDGNNIQCVEGNYSDGVGLTRYQLGNSIIAGFGRPNWAVVAEPESVNNNGTFDDVDDTPTDIVHPDVRRSYMHLQYGDGMESLGHIPSPQVRAWQSLLQCWGYVLDADGEFGSDTENATRQWQQKAQEIGADVEVNGIVDEDDWKEIIFVEV